MMDLKKISDYEWELPKEKEMNVSGKIFASKKILQGIQKDKTTEQIKNVAKLPGILKNSFAMPDAHQGYGFPIGGVAGFDLKQGVISPGGVGYDINCGIRVLATNISIKEFLKKRKEFLKEISKNIPSGVGRENKEKMTDKELDEILIHGAEFAVKNKFGKKEDLERCEENGKMKNANPKDVSLRAKARGKPQTGTLGSGNHFLEVQKVEKIFDKKTAEIFGIKENTICIMIHCGSRGLGHQIASDYIKLMEEEYGFKDLPDRELINAPINSVLGKKYLSAMNCAVNFAFYNRQIIMHELRKILEKLFPKNKNHLVYDVCHNIAKFEKHNIDRKNKEILVVRKGATRSFGPNRKEIPLVYRKSGQPVIIPGSMGTASYILVGTKKAEEISFGSTAHGAGRILSRTNANEKLTSEEVIKKLNLLDIEIEAISKKGIAEEAPEVYKDIEEVIKVSDEIGLTKKVARLKPVAVLKG